MAMTIYIFIFSKIYMPDTCLLGRIKKIVGVHSYYSHCAVPLVSTIGPAKSVPFWRGLSTEVATTVKLYIIGGRLATTSPSSPINVQYYIGQTMMLLEC